MKLTTSALALCMVLGTSVCKGQQAPAAPTPAFDQALAKTLGADERGMRNYVLVILKTGPNRVPARSRTRRDVQRALRQHEEALR